MLNFIPQILVKMITDFLKTQMNDVYDNFGDNFTFNSNFMSERY